MLQHYLDHDLKLRKFVPIIHGSVVYPGNRSRMSAQAGQAGTCSHSFCASVLYDANRVVLSLPPIINGAHSAVRHRLSASKAHPSRAPFKGCRGFPQRSKSCMPI